MAKKIKNREEKNKQTAEKRNQIIECDDFDNVLELINREFGSGSLMQGANNYVKVNTFPSGVPAMDIAMGCRGIPQGRIIEIYGPESSGKTTICLTIIASCQNHYFPEKKRNGKVVFIDAEHAFDPKWATKIGVNLDKLAISQPNSGEEALKIAEKLILSGKVDLIVVDSVAALVPSAELNGEIGDQHVGAQARMMSQALRKIAGICSKTSTTIIFINQIREKIGVMFGNPETTPGGRALKFYSSIRGQISKGSALKSGEDTIGFRPNIKFVKNKVGPPFTEASFDICVGHPARPVYGVDSLASLIDTGLERHVLTRNGSFYKYDDVYLGNGMAKARNYLFENSDVAKEISDKIYDKIFGNIDQLEVLSDDLDDDLIDKLKDGDD